MTDTQETVETPSGKKADAENFPVGSFLIRKDLRPHVHAYYLFARAADDISDNPLLDAAEKMARLDLFAHTLTTPGDESVPSCVPLRESLKQTGVDPAHALDLLTAFKRDATQRRYENWDDLLDYCRYSANPVGRYLLALHGEDPATFAAGDALCTVLQIVNHIQDCADDYRELDRVYIPLAMLAAQGSDPADLAREKATPGLYATLQAMVEKCAPLLQEAQTLSPQIKNRGLRMEVSVIATLADAMLRVLRKRDPLCERTKLGKPAVLRATLAGIVRAMV